MYNEKQMILIASDCFVLKRKHEIDTNKNKMARRQNKNNIQAISDQLAFDAKAFSLLLLFCWMSAWGKRARADDASSTYVPDLDQDADVTDDSNSSSFGVRTVVGIDDDAVLVLVERFNERVAGKSRPAEVHVEQENRSHHCV